MKGKRGAALQFNVYTTILFLLLLILSVSQFFPVMGVGVEGKTTYRKARELCQSFVYGKMMSGEGGIYGGYAAKNLLQGKFEADRILSETIGLSLEYAYLTGNLTLFELEERFAEKRLLSPLGVFYWRLNRDATPYKESEGMYSSALIDDLRILKYVLLGYEKWGRRETLSFALKAMKGLWMYVSDEGNLVEYLVWSDSGVLQKSDNVRISYLDLEALTILARYDSNWIHVRDQALKTIRQGKMSDAEFFHELYNLKVKRYSTPSGVVNTIHQLFITLHLLEIGSISDVKDTYSSLIKEYLEGNVVMDSYNPAAGSRGRWELDIGSYALIVQTSLLIGDVSAGESIIKNKITPFQDLGSTSTTYGAFTPNPGEAANAWDNLLTLISLILMEKPPLVLHRYMGESLETTPPIYDSFEKIKYVKDKFSDDRGIRPPPWGFEVWGGHPKLYALCNESRTGENALKIASNDPRSVVVIAIPDYFQKPCISQNVTYRFSVWVKMENVTGEGVRLFQQFFTQPKIKREYVAFPKYSLFGEFHRGSADWALMYLDAMSTWPEIVKGDPGIQFIGRGTIWIDDVAFIEVKRIEPDLPMVQAAAPPRLELDSMGFRVLPGQTQEFYVKLRVFNARLTGIEGVDLSGEGGEWIQVKGDLRFNPPSDKVWFTLTIPMEASPGVYEVTLNVAVRADDMRLQASTKLLIHVLQFPERP